MRKRATKPSFGVGDLVFCDKGKCIVLGTVRYGYILRAPDGLEWLRKEEELKLLPAMVAA